ncbi:hypothetical protein FS749_005292 [Ceratobasidium sp. UAMH 11750]|nr:hypothetical protein FS749_005292 [Ceratobasidium sp. UAMH 11750]
MNYNRTAEERNDPSIKAWRGRCGFMRYLHPKPRTCKCEVASCPLEVLLPPPTRLRLAIVIGAPGVFSGPGGSSTGGTAESNVTTREHSLPPIATLEDEEEGEDEEGEDDEEGEEYQDWGGDAEKDEEEDMEEDTADEEEEAEEEED